MAQSAGSPATATVPGFPPAAAGHDVAHAASSQAAMRQIKHGIHNHEKPDFRRAHRRQEVSVRLLLCPGSHQGRPGEQRLSDRDHLKRVQGVAPR